jgi:Uma2 family endonuclease
MVDSMKPARVATYQDVLDAPAHLVAELVAGELFLSPRPATPHAVVTYVLNDELLPLRRGSSGGPGGWFFLIEPELHVGDDIVVPDLAGWRLERKPLPAELANAFLTTRPDWVCEALSRSTQRLDRVKKVPIYAREGIGHAWLLDERNRLLEVHRRNPDTRAYELVDVYSEEQVVRAEPFAELELRLATLFAELPSRAGEGAVDYGR